MLAKKLSLPDGFVDWEFAPAFQEKATVEGHPIYLSGMQATHPQHGEVVGSSASLVAFPDSSASYELIERITIVESLSKPALVLRHETSEAVIGEAKTALVFPQSSSMEYRFAKSNGVALYSTWQEACRRAAMELVERHLILASWLGITKPLLMQRVRKTALHRLKNLYTVEHYDFGCQKTSSFPGTIYVTGVILKARDKGGSENNYAPLILGCGAGQSQAESLLKAEAETWQRLGFLWGEEIPNEDPEFAAHQLYHQEFYLYPKNHYRIDAWLRGDYFDAKKTILPRVLETRFADLSIEGAADLRVAKALADEAIPLVFGFYRGGLFADLEENRLIHPIA